MIRRNFLPYYVWLSSSDEVCVEGKTKMLAFEWAWSSLDFGDVNGAFAADKRVF